MKSATFSSLVGESGLFIDGDWVESKDQDKNGDVRLIQLADVGDGCFIDKSRRYLTSEKARELRCTYLEPGDLLIARMPDPLGRACIFPILPGPCVTVVDVCIVRPDPKLANVHWLKYMTNSPNFRRKIGQYIKGATRQRISRGNLEKIQFYLPLLDEQFRIAHTLGKVENLIAERTESIRLLDEYLKSIFYEMFGDPVRNERNWPSIPFTEIGKFISGGTPSKDRADFWDGDFPWVSPKDMKVSRLVGSQDRISTSVFRETNLKRIQPNHILIVVRGMILAHSFPVAINDVEIAINQDMKAIFPNSNLDSNFLLHSLNAQKRQILGLISSAGHGTKKLDFNAMQKLPIPVPPKSLQTEFAHVARNIERLKGKYQESLRELIHLFNSLNDGAFDEKIISK